MNPTQTDDAMDMDMNPAELYREDIYTDRKLGTIRQLTPVRPDGAPDGTAAATSFDGVADGVWYFHVMAGSSSGWGSTATLRIQVDTTGPRTAALGPSVVHRSVLTAVRFKVTDALSPTARVEIRVYRGGKLMRSIADESTTTGSVHAVKWRCRLPRGRYVLKVYATDLAGNAQRVLGRRTIRVC